MTTCPHCRTAARFPHVLLSATYICARCRRRSTFQLGSRAFLGCFAGFTTWITLVLTHRSAGAAGSLVAGVAAGCAAGLLGAYLFGWLEPMPGADDNPPT